jgi:hypothetical protein
MLVAELKFTGELFLFLISEIIFHVTFLWSQVGMQLSVRLCVPPPSLYRHLLGPASRLSYLLLLLSSNGGVFNEQIHLAVGACASVVG